MSIDVNDLASIYTNFFKTLWNKGYSTKLYGKQVIYAKLTPPYVRERVESTHGSQRSIWFPYLLKILPNKKKILEKNSKIFVTAILNTWMRKEKSSSVFLQSLLELRNISYEGLEMTDSISDLVPPTQPISNDSQVPNNYQIPLNLLSSPTKYEQTANHTSQEVRRTTVLPHLNT